MLVRTIYLLRKVLKLCAKDWQHFTNVKKHIRKILPCLREEIGKISEVRLAGRRVDDRLYRHAEEGERQEEDEDRENEPEQRDHRDSIRHSSVPYPRHRA